VEGIVMDFPGNRLSMVQRERSSRRGEERAVPESTSDRCNRLRDWQGCAGDGLPLGVSCRVSGLSLRSKGVRIRCAVARLT
jgi:hypothetical protein